MDSKQKQSHLLLRVSLKLAAVCLTVVLALVFVIGVYRMSGNSMFPAVRDGDLCITYKLDDYRSGDVVAYTAADGVHIARIVAHGGDVIDADEQGFTVNGAHRPEEIFYPTPMENTVLELPLTVAEGEYFLLNDFRSDLSDSRSFGCIPESALHGKLIINMRIRGF